MRARIYLFWASRLDKLNPKAFNTYLEPKKLPNREFLTKDKRKSFGYVILGFALTEAVAFFALMMAFLIFLFSSKLLHSISCMVH